MTFPSKVAFNPLPWIWTADSFDLSEPTVRAAVRGTAAAGFTAIHADVPAGMSAQEYLDLLHGAGLVPAPGYIACRLDVSGGHREEEVESARRRALVQRELGLTEVLVAGDLCPERMARPAVGAGFDAHRLTQVVATLSDVAAAITEVGVRPCLHPHVGTWIETERELRVALDSIDAALLGFGPDNGHLTWAGMDPAGIVREYADRVGVAHLKDVHSASLSRAAADADGFAAAMFERAIWTEPGRGDADLDGFLAALPDDFSGWLVVEVDVPDRCTKEESAARAYSWVRQRQMSA